MAVVFETFDETGVNLVSKDNVHVRSPGGGVKLPREPPCELFHNCNPAAGYLSQPDLRSSYDVEEVRHEKDHQ
jgi:hypothetical protein